MISTGFSLKDSEKRAWFFDKTFLLADTSIEVVLGMFFLSLSKSNWKFGAKKLTWRSYTATEIFFITKKVELINKHKFSEVVLDKNTNMLILHIAILEAPESTMSIHLLQSSLLAVLEQKEASLKIGRGYKEYINVFSPNLVMKLPENTGIIEHTSELVKAKKSLYRLIYTLSPVKLEIVKMYI